jgi:hypothetical protein
MHFIKEDPHVRRFSIFARYLKKYSEFGLEMHHLFIDF